jgi:hypothetical protein
MQATDRDQRLVFGYLWAVASATIVLILYFFGASRTSWGVELHSPLILLGSLILTAIFVLFVGFCVLVSAMIPFGILFVIAERFSIRNVLYYIILGALTGLILTPAFTVFQSSVNPLPFYERCIANAPLLAFSGCFGGFVYWWKAGRGAGTSPSA